MPGLSQARKKHIDFVNVTDFFGTSQTKEKKWYFSNAEYFNFFRRSECDKLPTINSMITIYWCNVIRTRNGSEKKNDKEDDKQTYTP